MVSNSFCSLARRWFPLALLSLVSLSAQSSGHLKVGELAKLTAARGAVVEVKIPVTVDAGFHVNSNHPSDEYLIPLKLTWTSLGALDGGAVTYPAPQKYDFMDKPLSVFSGAFALTASFKVAATAPPGPGMATGKLRYQACNSNTCFPPKNADVTVTYQVQ